jgi:hypothetical protein
VPVGKAAAENFDENTALVDQLAAVTMGARGFELLEESVDLFLQLVEPPD